VVAIGEAQARLAAGGLIGNVGTSAVILVDPAWATAIAIVTALAVIAIALGAWRLARRVPLFGAGAFLLVAAVIVTGTLLSTDALDPARRDPLGQLLSGAAHSPLLIAVAVGALLMTTLGRRGGRLGG